MKNEMKGPHAAAIRAVLVVLADGGEAHDLAQVALSLAINSSERLPHDILVVLVAYSSQGLFDRKLVSLRGLVTAISNARARSSSHSGMVTSPGRRPGADPKIPFFSSAGDSSPSLAIDSTKLRKALWRTMRSPEIVQQVAWSP